LQRSGEAEARKIQEEDAAEGQGATRVWRPGEQGAHCLGRVAGQVKSLNHPVAYAGFILARYDRGNHDQQRDESGECVAGDDQPKKVPWIATYRRTHRPSSVCSASMRSLVMVADSRIDSPSHGAAPCFTH
jgi:hypothetical protein